MHALTGQAVARTRVDAETVAEIKIFDSRSGIQKSSCGTLRILGYVRKLVRSAGAI